MCQSLNKYVYLLLFGMLFLVGMTGVKALEESNLIAYEPEGSGTTTTDDTIQNYIKDLTENYVEISGCLESYSKDVCQEYITTVDPTVSAAKTLLKGLSPIDKTESAKLLGTLVNPTMVESAKAGKFTADSYASFETLRVDAEDYDTNCDGTTTTADCTTLRTTIRTNSTQFTSDFSGEPLACTDFDDLPKILWGIILIAGPAMLIVFGTLDFSKAALASDKDAMKKAASHFAKRSIAVVLLVILPFIVQIILGLAKDAGIIESDPIICIDQE